MASVPVSQGIEPEISIWWRIDAAGQPTCYYFGTHDSAARKMWRAGQHAGRAHFKAASAEEAKRAFVAACHRIPPRDREALRQGLKKPEHETARRWYLIEYAGRPARPFFANPLEISTLELSIKRHRPDYPFSCREAAPREASDCLRALVARLGPECVRVLTSLAAFVEGCEDPLLSSANFSKAALTGSAFSIDTDEGHEKRTYQE